MFKNRQQAGKLLSEKLKQYKGTSNTIVIGIARGGVVVAKVIAQQLNMPFSVLVIKKIGAPQNPELAVGAVGPSHIVYWDKSLIKALQISKKAAQQEFKIKQDEQEEKERALGIDSSSFDFKGKTVILVDDGVATGATVLCAQKYFKTEKIKKLVLAIPVISVETYKEIENKFDAIIALQREQEFHAVGQFYKEFTQVSDREVQALLKNSLL